MDTPPVTDTSSKVRWQCPLCLHHWDFHAYDAGEVDFFVVYHFVNKHQLRGSQILELAPRLLSAVNDYPGRLSPEPS